MKKSIWRHVQENGLSTKYSDFSSENLIRRHLKMLACLAFVPVDFVVAAFVELQSCISNDLKKFFTYFEKITSVAKKEPKYLVVKLQDLAWNCGTALRELD